jgi:EAL domain-containing protein (putative c-di-GMP-specific phosphodiesterase class I)/AmiR/NasT family two-component response regulator
MTRRAVKPNITTHHAQPLINMLHVIDDDPQVLEQLAFMISRIELPCMTYSSAGQFIDNLERLDGNALVILDLEMPYIDGIQVMRYLANMDDPPALILMNEGDPSILFAAEKLGQAHKLRVLASIRKPLDSKSFFPAIKKALSTFHLPRTTEVKNQQYIGDHQSLVRALDNDEFELHYQPQVTISGRRLSGIEALIRWNHPDHGLIYPDTFLPVVENNGLIDDVTGWVLENATRQAARFYREGMKVNVSVNVSAINIRALTFPEQLSSMLTNHDMDPSHLMLEITESALMGEVVTSLDILTRTRLRGIRLSIDDFGTGYSSLQQLHRAPFSELKIDRSFVANIRHDAEARSIVKICAMLGRELGMSTIAEGVEDEQTLSILTDLGCDIVQGYLIASPMPVDSLCEWARKVNRVH